MPDEFESAPQVEDQQTEQQQSDAPDTGTAETEERFTDVDLSQQPEGGYTPEWLQERYQQMQSDYTKKTQSIAEQRKQYESDLDLLNRIRSDPQAQADVIYEILSKREDMRESVFRDLAGVLGFDVEDGEVDDEEGRGEDVSFRDPRLDDFLAQQEREKQEEEWNAFLRGVEEHQAEEFAAIEKEAGFKLSDEEKDVLVAYAVSNMPQDSQSPPDYRAAWNHLRKLEGNFQSRWLQSKQAAQVGIGTAGSTGFDFTNDADRRRHTAAIIEAFSTQQNA